MLAWCWVFATFLSRRTLCNTLENESKTMRKISGYLIFVVFLFSCSSTKIADSKIQKLNGKYDANSIQSSTNRNENFIKLLNRQLIRDSLNYEILPYFKFELKVKNKNHLIINKINGENKIVNLREYKFRRKSDYIILKNKNVKTILIPYLIGALDVYKLGLKNNENGDLEVMINEHRSGGLFLIPMGWTEEISYEKYKKIE